MPYPSGTGGDIRLFRQPTTDLRDRSLARNIVDMDHPAPTTDALLATSIIVPQREPRDPGPWPVGHRP